MTETLDFFRGRKFKDEPALLDSLYRRLDDYVTVEPFSGCWLWTGPLSRDGYGTISCGDKNTLLAHRCSFMRHKGAIPAGLELDHLCRTRSCVNPNHLEAVTRRENIIRGALASVTRARNAAKTHCKWGHPLFGPNVYARVNSRTLRQCKTCVLNRNRKRRAWLKINGTA